MTARLQYGTTAKVFHWLVVALLLVQYLIGWLMPDLHRDMKPGAGMTFHISFGITILVLIVLRFAWRLAHPVAPESSLPPWQRLSAEAVHWILYVLVLATTLSGWLFASFRGWGVSFSTFSRCRCWHPTTPRPARRSTACIRRRNGRCWCSSASTSPRRWPTFSSTATASCSGCCRDRAFSSEVETGSR